MFFLSHLETERLHFERLCHDTVDAFDYYDYCSHREQSIDEVTRHLPWDPHETVKETVEHIDELETKWEAGTRAEYLIRPKAGEKGAGEIAGAGGMRIDWETKTARPFIWLRKPFWGREYSGERAGAIIELAFDRLDLDLVAVSIKDGNEKSRQAVEKYIDSYGGQYDGIIRNATVRPDGTVVDHHRYTITQDQYDQISGGGKASSVASWSS
ncbi:GNAT family protein [Halostagnicola sp. A-GB9-2]|uniref:GNAT family N-acetyltransferase n=1 Tax=Halostagnicola sp. A-GB9-2 TaxID=3048066 RepID=UPI0024C0C746|nr:GNAT family protein [Halostagnicola sp. A-GB9-2]MDJ1430813.1 GNAT family protein [Halostagnicola sp. A-GB9-2]